MRGYAFQGSECTITGPAVALVGPTSSGPEISVDPRHGAPVRLSAPSTVLNTLIAVTVSSGA